MGFLPKEFKESMSNSRYWKIKDMPQGENRFRIVQSPISGWIDWKDQRPYRYRHEDKPSKPFDSEKPLRAFVSCYVWDYTRKGLYILEFNQKTLIMALDGLSDSEDWGDLTSFDLKLDKKGSGPTVKYTLNPAPHKPMADEIKIAMRRTPVILEALFSGGDPWNWTSETPLESPNASLDEEVDGFDDIIDPWENKAPSPAMGPLDELKEHLAIDGINTDRLEEWVKLRAHTKNESVETILKTCLDKSVLPKFKKSFAKYIAPIETEVATA